MTVEWLAFAAPDAVKTEERTMRSSRAGAPFLAAPGHALNDVMKSRI